MKEIFKFVRWQWHKFEFWQKMFIFATIVQAIGIFIPGWLGLGLMAAGFGIVFFYLLKWAVWERTIESWNKYKQEKTNLFDTIKISDQK